MMAKKAIEVETRRGMPKAITPTIVNGRRRSGGRKTSVRSASFVIIVVSVCIHVEILRSQVSVTVLNEKWRVLSPPMPIDAGRRA
jgi:hypothetical protein